MKMVFTATDVREALAYWLSGTRMRGPVVIPETEVTWRDDPPDKYEITAMVEPAPAAMAADPSAVVSASAGTFAPGLQELIAHNQRGGGGAAANGNPAAVAEAQRIAGWNSGSPPPMAQAADDDDDD